jgi:stalled ribosome alternative rescue factor ArfA
LFSQRKEKKRAQKIQPVGSYLKPAKKKKEKEMSESQSVSHHYITSDPL